MKKTLTLCGKPVTIENNALLPRTYRHTFGRDLVVDMQALAKQYKDNPTDLNTEVLENITWLMLKAGGEQVGENHEEWLATLDDTFAVHKVVSQVRVLNVSLNPLERFRGREHHACLCRFKAIFCLILAGLICLLQDDAEI